MWYPVIGVLIGGGLAALGMMVQRLPDQGVAAAILVTGWVALTGGLHLDGLADTADAWIGGMGDRERALQILKDPHCGSFAIIVLILLLLLKWNLLRVVIQQEAWQVLWIAALLGRSGVVLLFLTLPYVRPNGMGAQAVAHLPRAWAWGTLVFSCCLVMYWASWYVVLIWLVVLFSLRKGWLSRFGGTTGDLAGATCEILETVVLLVWWP